MTKGTRRRRKNKSHTEVMCTLYFLAGIMALRQNLTRQAKHSRFQVTCNNFKPKLTGDLKTKTPKTEQCLQDHVVVKTSRWG